ncbi:unnamed protein product [Clavelina lepadiformis]|uniref:Uncharacterized protein n=1 Tax=Clavelina lepadiformis TaxID=159417 RepID=A0ABP0F2W4_CLALP
MRFLQLTLVWAVILQTGLCQRQRPCRAPAELTSSINATSVQINYQAQLISADSGNEIIVTVIASWETIYSEGFEPDGFLVKIFSAGTSGEEQLPILNHCTSSNGAWISDTDCDQDDIVSPNCPTGIEPSADTCLCRSSNCSRFDNLNCRGVNSWQQSDGLLAVGKDVRSLEAIAEFHTSYQITLRPYYREAVSLQDFGITQAGANDCHQLVTESTNLSAREAVKICCELNVPHFLPLDLKASEIKVNFTSGKASAIISWLPPVFKENIEFKTLVPTTDFNDPPVTGNIDRILTAQVPEYLDVPCYDSTYSYQFVVSNLNIRNNYLVRITPSFADNITELYCERPSLCTSVYDLQLEDVNFCDEPFNPCLDNYICVRNVTSASETLYSCEYNSAGKALSVSLLLKAVFASVLIYSTIGLL